MVTSNTRLCVHIVNLIAPNGGLRDDLFSAALKGLVDATESYDPVRGSFSSWAGFYVRREVYNTLSVLGYPVTTPQRFARSRRLVQEARARIEARGIDPTIARLANESRLHADTIQAVLFLEAPPLALDSSDGPAENSAGCLPACNRPTPAASVLKKEDHARLRDAMVECLSKTERKVLGYYYGLDDGPAESLVDIGRRMGVTRQRVQHIAFKAQAKLREAMGEAGVEDSRGCVH